MTQSTLTTGAPKSEKHPSRGAVEVAVLTALFAVTLVMAWAYRDEGHLTAEAGVGYALGIAGSVMMLIMLIYPLRKRLSALRAIGSVPVWFRLHMALGITGPGFILLHSNFNLGSLNSRVALFAMLFVAGSGYIGRFLYFGAKQGLGGYRRLVAELASETADTASAMDAEGLNGQALRDYQQQRLPAEPRLSTAIGNLMTRKSSRRAFLKQIVPGRSAFVDRPPPPFLGRYLRDLSRAETRLLFERLFALWHLLHLPLFVLLVFAACLHVVAVHLY